MYENIIMSVIQRDNKIIAEYLLSWPKFLKEFFEKILQPDYNTRNQWYTAALFPLFFDQSQVDINKELGGHGRSNRDEVNPFREGVYASELRYISEIRQYLGSMFQGTFIDIGSGEGIPLLMLAAIYPDAKFIGYELNEQKVKLAQKAAKKFNLTNVTFIQQDLGCPTFTLPKANVYYMYAPCGSKVTGKILKEMNRYRNFTLINSYQLTCFGRNTFPKSFKRINVDNNYSNVYIYKKA